MVAAATAGLTALAGVGVTTTIAQAAVPAATSTTMVSSLTPTRAVSGGGRYERNASVGKKPVGDGKTLTINGKRYKNGLGVHSHSVLVYKLAKRYDTFRARVGVDDEVGSRGSVVFKVFVNGKSRYRSPVMRGSEGSRAVVVDVTGATTLKLVVTKAGDGGANDHADWAAPD